jgi:DNA polymerase-3 subunit gamma/tau
MISHAYLFSGPRGSGKTTLARLFAKAVNCENRKENQFEPCNQCSSCKEIMESRSLDLIEIDAASHRGIDEIRELREGIKFTPVKSKYKVFIIDESHQLTKEAANALLKTLEEPPRHAIFILATTEIQKMIPTIISRCQRFDFRRLTFPEIINRLKVISEKEKVKIDQKALELIAINSGGSCRDAESILDQVLIFSQDNQKISANEVKRLLGLVEINLVSQFVDFLIEKNLPAALNFINEILEKGYGTQEFIRALINYLRQGLITKINDKIFNPILASLTEEEFARLKEQISRLKESELHHFLEIFLTAENKMKYSPLPQLPLELAVVEICQEKKET